MRRVLLGILVLAGCAGNTDPSTPRGMDGDWIMSWSFLNQATAGSLLGCTITGTHVWFSPPDSMGAFGGVITEGGVWSCDGTETPAWTEYPGVQLGGTLQDSTVVFDVVVTAATHQEGTLHAHIAPGGRQKLSGTATWYRGGANVGGGWSAVRP